MNAITRPDGLRSLNGFTDEHRRDLADALTVDLRRWNAPTEAIEAAETLRSGESYAIVTGQQAGIATGPLYTLYKAIGVVLAARELERAHPGRRFVPVFWIEADDHDFDEIRRLTVIDRVGGTTTAAYDDGDAHPRHVGDRRISGDGMAGLIDALRGALQPTDFTDEVLRIVADAYGRPGETLADGFARTFYAILGRTPLVLASSRNPGLKRLAAPIFTAEASDPALLYDAVQRQTAALRAKGRPTPVDPKQGALFLTYDGERRSLDLDGDGYRIRGTEKRLRFAEAAELATRSPERFSPNVLLRPLAQDRIFPTAMYLGGPSEVAYLHQVQEAYAAFGMEAPMIGQRPFVLLIEPKVRRALDGGRFPLEELLRPDFDPAAALVDSELDAELDAARERSTRKLHDAYAELAAITARIDPTLEKALGAATANGTKSLDDLAKRLQSALRKKEQTEIDRLAGARALLLPGGKLQERIVNPIYVLNKYGLAGLRAALAAIKLQPGMMQVIDL